MHPIGKNSIDNLRPFEVWSTRQPVMISGPRDARAGRCVTDMRNDRGRSHTLCHNQPIQLARPSSVQAAWTSTSSSVSLANIKRGSCTSAFTFRMHPTRPRRTRSDSGYVTPTTVGSDDPSHPTSTMSSKTVSGPDEPHIQRHDTLGARTEAVRGELRGRVELSRSLQQSVNW